MTGIPGAGEGFIPIHGQNMVIPADNSRPHPRGRGSVPVPAKSYPRSITVQRNKIEIRDMIYTSNQMKADKLHVPAKI